MPAPLPLEDSPFDMTPGSNPDLPSCIALTVFDVSVPLNPSRLQQIAVFYSMLPWIGAVFWTLAAFTFRRTSLIVPLLWVMLLIVISEGFVKIVFPMDRPQGTCLHSKGMPSSHSAISVGMLVWCLLTTRTRRHGSPVPLRKLIAFVGLCLVLVPVPFSRVYLHDHSWVQVIVGSILGSTCASIVALVCERKSDTLAAMLQRCAAHILHDDAYAGAENEEPVFFDIRNKTSGGNFERYARYDSTELRDPMTAS
eukprot:Hpha_TRINITY_DN13687_c0_g1::TRINITY_DN13687_c0_g1_i1::g.122687::m.122687